MLGANSWSKSCRSVKHTTPPANTCVLCLATATDRCTLWAAAAPPRSKQSPACRGETLAMMMKTGTTRSSCMTISTTATRSWRCWARAAVGRCAAGHNQRQRQLWAGARPAVGRCAAGQTQQRLINQGTSVSQRFASVHSAAPLSVPTRSCSAPSFKHAGA